MKSPFTGGKVTKKIKTETYVFRKERFTIEQYYYVCEDTGNTFTDAEIDNLTIQNIYEKYRERHSIPSPVELKKLREKYRLSAHIMSKIAGIGINQYGLYENGELPTIIIGQKLNSLFNKKTLLVCIDQAKIKLGKDYLRVRNLVESYPEPKTYQLAQTLYSQFSETKPINNSSTSILMKRAQWATYQFNN